VAYGLRARAAATLLSAAAFLVVAAAPAPSANWANRRVVFADGGLPSLGPDPPAPELLVALVIVALAALRRRARLAAALLVPFAFLIVNAPGWNSLLLHFTHDLPGALAIGAALALLATGVARLASVRLRALLLAAGAVTAVAVTLPRTDLGDPAVRYADPWTADLGVAVALALAGALLGTVAALRAAGSLVPEWADMPALVAERTAPILASEAEREACAARLRHAAAEGRLDLTELDERLEITYSARTRRDLAQLTADLPRRWRGRPPS